MGQLPSRDGESLADVYDKYISGRTFVDLRDFEARRKFRIKSLTTTWFPKEKAYFATRINFEDGSTYIQRSERDWKIEAPKKPTAWTKVPQGDPKLTLGATDPTQKAYEAIARMYKACTEAGMDSREATDTVIALIGSGK